MRQEKEYKKIVLENGVRVILVPRKESLGSAVLVMTHTGSENENKNNNGISHFLEHMVFKGTKNYPKPSAISTAMESLGAIYNAYTSSDRTGYWAEVRNEELDKAIDIIFDIYLNPLIKQTELEKEKGVIIQELNMYYENPQRHIYDLFNNVLYGDQPAGWNIIGTKDNILKFTSQDLLDYHAKHYKNGSSTVIVIAGNFSEKKIMEKIRKNFSKLNRAKLNIPETLDQQKSSQILMEYRDINQTNLIIGFKAYNIFDKRHYALDILNEILGGGMSSRLFIAIREKLGAAYEVSSFTDYSSDRGVLGITVGIENEKLEKVLKTILLELNILIKYKVSSKELNKAKKSFISPLILNLQRVNQLAFFYGSSEILTQNPETLDRMIKKYQSLTSEDIKEAAKGIFQNNKLNLAIIGPFKNKDAIEKILKF